MLPVLYRPNADVYVPVTLVNGKAGRLNIFKTGNVFLQAAVAFGDAGSFTSLEGVTFTKN